MGGHIIVTQPDRDAKLKVELHHGSIQWAADQGFIPGTTRERDGVREHVLYVEYNEDADRSRRRAAWLLSEQGQRALERALEADARGECACDELLAGPDPRLS